MFSLLGSTPTDRQRSQPQGNTLGWQRIDFVGSFAPFAHWQFPSLDRLKQTSRVVSDLVRVPGASATLSPFLLPDGMSLIFSWPSASQYLIWACCTVTWGLIVLNSTIAQMLFLELEENTRLYHIHHDLLLLRNYKWKRARTSRERDCRFVFTSRLWSLTEIRKWMRYAKYCIQCFMYMFVCLGCSIRSRWWL